MTAVVRKDSRTVGLCVPITRRSGGATSTTGEVNLGRGSQGLVEEALQEELAG